MNKTDVLNVCAAMGFILNSDQWDDEGYLTFFLSKDNRQIYPFTWYRDSAIEPNVGAAIRIAFKVGQQVKIFQFAEIVNL